MHIFGYDPGGNNKHGVASLKVSHDLSPVSIEYKTMKTAQDAINFFDSYENSIGIGIDTLTRWCTGYSGWRPADQWLRNQYRKVQVSIMTPNYLSGSMIVNGMVIKEAYSRREKIGIVSETHPKVIYFALTGDKYNWEKSKQKMIAFLSNSLGIEVLPNNDDEFDAIISCFCVQQYLLGKWKNDLHTICVEKDGKCIDPFIKSIYCWP